MLLLETAALAKAFTGGDSLPAGLGGPQLPTAPTLHTGHPTTPLLRDRPHPRVASPTHLLALTPLRQLTGAPQRAPGAQRSARPGRPAMPALATITARSWAARPGAAHGPYGLSTGSPGWSDPSRVPRETSPERCRTGRSGELRGALKTKPRSQQASEQGVNG